METDALEWQNSRSQLDKELAAYPWLKPVAIEILGGEYDPAAVRFPLKLFVGKEPATDIRNWTAIRQWARDLAPRLVPGS